MTGNLKAFPTRMVKRLEALRKFFSRWHAMAKQPLPDDVTAACKQLVESIMSDLKIVKDVDMETVDMLVDSLVHACKQFVK